MVFHPGSCELSGRLVGRFHVMLSFLPVLSCLVVLGCLLYPLLCLYCSVAAWTHVMDRDLEIPYSYMHTMSSVAYPHVNIPVVYTRNYLFVELERE